LAQWFFMGYYSYIILQHFVIKLLFIKLFGNLISHFNHADF